MLHRHMAPSSRFSHALVAMLVLGCVAATGAQDKKLNKLAPLAPPTATITEASIRGHMEFLAGDAMQGRGSGTVDEWRTAEYIASNLRRWGLEPMGDDGGYVQKIATGRSSAATPPMLAAGAIVLTHGREMIVQSINKGAVTGPLFRYTPGAKVPDGAFVFVPDGATVDNAAVANAAGMLTVETPQIRTQWAATGGRLPAAAAVAAARPRPPSSASFSTKRRTRRSPGWWTARRWTFSAWCSPGTRGMRRRASPARIRR